MVLSKLYSAGRPTIWIIVGQRPTALAVGAGGDVCTFNSQQSFFFSFSLTLGDGPTEILSQRAVKTKTTNQPYRFARPGAKCPYEKLHDARTQCESLRRSHLRCLNRRTENRRPIYRMAPAANTK